MKDHLYGCNCQLIATYGENYYINFNKQRGKQHMEKLQGKLNRQAEQFKPRKTERIIYVQPQQRNGRIEYIQPRKGSK